MLRELRELLKGKKTYLVSLAAIALGIYQNMPDLIMVGLLGLTGRAGLSKLVPEVEVAVKREVAKQMERLHDEDE